jgi:putative endonuclease
MYFIYAIKNNINNKIYIGQTSNLKNRIDRHNDLLKNKNTSFTSKNKNLGEWILIYSEEFKTRKEAKIREKQLKSYQGRVFIKNLF